MPARTPDHRPRTSPSAASTAASSAPSSSTSAAASTTASTSPATRPPTPTASAATSSSWSRELGVSAIRYPGGNFVSGFRWEDSVGPRERPPAPARPRLALAPRPTRSGLHEFAALARARSAASSCSRSTSAPAASLEALDLLEYCQHPGRHRARPTSGSPTARPSRSASRCGASATRWTAPGSSATARADDYGKLAVADGQGDAPARPGPRARRLRHPRAPHMPTFGEWERDRARRTPTTTSTTSPATPTTRSTTATSAASSPRPSTWTTSSSPSSPPPTTSGPSCGSTKTHQHLLRRVERLVHRRATTTSTRSPASTTGRSPRACSRTPTRSPTPSSFGNLLISLLQARRPGHRAPRLAQLVNVIAPIMTEPGGPAWRQTTFFPFAMTSRLAQGQALEVELDAPTYPPRSYGEVPLRRRRGDPRRGDRPHGRLPGQPQPDRGHRGDRRHRGARRLSVLEAPHPRRRRRSRPRTRSGPRAGRRCSANDCASASTGASSRHPAAGVVDRDLARLRPDARADRP